MKSPLFASARTVSLLLALALGGCGALGRPSRKPAAPPLSHLQNTAEADGLAVTLKLPKRLLAVGETVSVTVEARNVTDRPIRIVAPTRARCVVRLWRHIRFTWEEVKEYPPSAMRLRTPWTLPPGGSRTFRQTIPVEPDWPTGLALRMTAELNGTTRPVAVLTVKIEPGKPGS